MIEVVLSKIKIDETRAEQVIIFREKDGSRFLPVVIGVAEVNAIKMKLGGITPPRPLTHDLLLSAIKELGGRLEEVLIDKLESNTFFAKLKVISKESEHLIDARPSDSVALAVRADVPIFVAEEVLEAAGVTEL